MRKYSFGALPLLFLVMLAIQPLLGAGDEDLQAAYRDIIENSITKNFEARSNSVELDFSAGNMPSRFTLFYWHGVAFYLEDLRSDGSEESLSIVQDSERLIPQLVLATANAVRTDVTAAGNQLIFAQPYFIGLYQFADGLGAFTAEEKDYIEESIALAADELVATKIQRGSMNRTSYVGFGLAATIQLLPAHPSVPVWEAWELTLWQDWALFEDTYEDASGYNGLWLMSVIRLALATGREEVLRSEKFLDLAERLTISIAPNGALADFGNTYFGHGSFDWAYALEYLGKIAPERNFQGKADRLVFFIRDTSLDLAYELSFLVGAYKQSEGRSATERTSIPHSTLNYRTSEFGDVLFDKMKLQVMTPDGMSHLLVDLHTSGYHGHQDGGAISLWALGENVLLHELGREAIWEWEHQSLTAANSGEQLFKGSSLDNIIPVGKLMRWGFPHRWPGTYTGGPTLDIERVNNFFIRIADVDGFDGTITIEVEGIYGVLPDGTEVRLHEGFSRILNRSSSTTNERTFVGDAFADPDLSAYESLIFAWSTDVPAAFSQIGLNGYSLRGQNNETASLRWYHFGQKTTAAKVTQGEGYAHGVLTRRLQTVEGRLLTHERSLTLTGASGSLIVVDKVIPDETGFYRIGPNWHTQQLIWKDDHRAWIRDLRLGTNLDPIQTPAPMWGVFSSTHSSILDRVVEDVGGQQAQHLSYNFDGNLEAGEAVEFISVWKPYRGKTAPFTPRENVRITREESSWLVQVEDELIRVADGFPKILNLSISLNRLDTGLEIDYEGTIQESTDLRNWSDMDPQPLTPFKIPGPPVEKEFYRTVP